MVSYVPARPSERYVPGTGPVRLAERASHARALPAPDDASLTLGRRIGVLVVLVALAAAIVLAANGGGGGGGVPGAAAQPTDAAHVAAASTVTAPVGSTDPLVPVPVGQPAFLAPASTLVNRKRVPLRVHVPDPGVAWDGLELRVFRGGSEVLRQPIGPEDLNGKGRISLAGIPLKSGSNRLSVALANAGGLGPVSEPLTMRVDDRPPKLRVTAPKSGVAINAGTVTVEGRTVPGIRVIVRNMTTDQKVAAFADGQGRFSAKIGLKRGRATIKVVVSDAAGNQNPKQIVIVRGNGKPQARLTLSRTTFKRAALPRTMDATVSVLDADGRPVKGAQVVFSFAPSGPPARLKPMTTTKLGTARWSGIRLTTDVVVGDGLVTVRVTLPDGRELTSTKHFTVG
jgi:hypothetical protein